jgi:outer membrane protein OmpA-like peptidoglycan-associated protein
VNHSKSILLSLCVLIGTQSNILANDESKESPSHLRFLNFGVTERFTTQSSFSGINLSTLITWNPHYQMTPWLNIEGQIGGTAMTSNKGSFVAGRYQVGASFHNLFPSLFENEDRFVPEILLGAETWVMSSGGTYFATSLNFHYRFHFENHGLLNAVDALHIGYQWLPGAPASAQQYTFGLRIVPFPERRIGTETQPAEPAPIATPEPTPSPTPAPVSEQITAPVEPQATALDIQKGAIAEVLPDGVRVTLPVSRVSFETGSANIDKEGLKFAEGFCQIISFAQENWNRIEIVGHTDNRGKESYNKKLSLARAKKLENQMKAAGVANSKLVSIGAGSSEYQDLGDNEASWKASRKVVVRIYGDYNGLELAELINEFDSKYGK